MSDDGYNRSGIIGGYGGPKVKNSMLGRNLKSREFLSNQLAGSALTGIAPFTPLQFLWPTGTEPGVYWRFNQSGFEYQDDLGTLPVTAVGQSVGKLLDSRSIQSGAVPSNSLTQPIATARPTTAAEAGGWNQSIYSTVFDGIDDGLSTPVFAAATLSANMDLFCAIKRNSNADSLMLSIGGAGSSFIGVATNGGAGLDFAFVGAAHTQYIDGVQLGGVANTTRDQLFQALTLGQWHVFEMRNIDLSAWTQLTIGAYAAFVLASNVGTLAICPAQSQANRDQARRIIGAQVGLLL